jgi:SRSO17 transposase
VTEQASCPLDWRLFVPESWDDPAMAERRTACHVPKQVRHRPKWQLVLDMLDELEQWDLRPPVLVGDAGYGDVGCFCQGLEDRQIAYVVQVKADTSAYPSRCARPRRRTPGGAAALDPATATRPPRSSSSLWRPDSRPAWT